jgi:hypothetical protein
MEIWDGKESGNKADWTLDFEQSSCILYTVHLLLRDWVTYRVIACAIICHVTYKM